MTILKSKNWNKIRKHCEWFSWWFYIFFFIYFNYNLNQMISIKQPWLGGACAPRNPLYCCILTRLDTPLSICYSLVQRWFSHEICNVQVICYIQSKVFFHVYFLCLQICMKLVCDGDRVNLKSVHLTLFYSINAHYIVSYIMLKHDLMYILYILTWIWNDASAENLQ